MIEKVNDEMLMAYVDGELDSATAERVRAAMAGDPGLAARAEGFRVSREAVRRAFADLRASPPPQRLVAAILEAPNREEPVAGPQPAQAKVIAIRPRRVAAMMLPLAACLALAFGLGGYRIGLGSSPVAGDPLGGPELARALGDTKGGATSPVMMAGGEATLATLDTFRVPDGLCRTFEVSGGALAQPVRGVGCDHGSGWRVDLAVAVAGVTGGYAPASGGALGSIDAYLDEIGAEGPLTLEEEAAATR